MKTKGLFQLVISILFFILLYYIFFTLKGIRLTLVLLFMCLEITRIIVEALIQKQPKQSFIDKDKNTFNMIKNSIYLFLLVLLTDFTFINRVLNTYLIIFGVLAFCLGFAVRIIAFVKLGEYFNKKVVAYCEHRIVKECIYKYIRHPLYLGIIIIYVGYITMLHSVLGLVYVLFIIMPIYINRMNVEEAALLEKFGGEYKLYIENTKKLIPFIW